MGRRRSLKTSRHGRGKPSIGDAQIEYFKRMLADSPQAVPAQLEKLMADPPVANAELGDGKVEPGFEASSREFVALPSAQHEFGKMFLALASQQHLPALFHCTTGKDRTGWAAAAFLTLLGIPKEQVYEDYLRSNDYILPAYRKVIDGLVGAGGEPEIPEAILGVKKEYLDAAFDEMRTRYDTIENCFSTASGIDAAEQQALRDFYLKRNQPSVADAWMELSDDSAFRIDPHWKPYTHLDFKNDPDEFQVAGIMTADKVQVVRRCWNQPHEPISRKFHVRYVQVHRRFALKPTNNSIRQELHREFSISWVCSRACDGQPTCYFSAFSRRPR